ncbi:MULTISPECIES: HAMP domain-containing sensor histidine kinase [unclassified Sphingomonas]|uniref:sensor histidine kinase n=1 Tax=unclassified Sphingomonas TaxID=196159 RepID=UPI000E74EE1E|nr:MULTISPECIES: HAMP domain-containing sensor histidine kinase [unclassified Sphingomonas]RKE53551.1 signal transduction histidine kinase [Sphingomonas sp. PP-CC-1A-547]TCM10045.1 signal transduction histidine kinase [Sphingomonas sp. PP-CC-3G-468]
MTRLRLIPRSLFGRMLAIAALSTGIALLFAGVTIGHVLERFVTRGLDERLDAQVAVLARGVRPDATLDRTRAIDLPEFGEPGSDWSWQVEGPAGRFDSGTTPPPTVSKPAPTIPPPPPGRPRNDERPLPPGPGGHEDRQIHPGEARDRSGERLHLRTMEVATPRGTVTITAIGPRRIVEEPLREAMIPLLGSLALLGVGLALATLVQLRFGLRPLRDLRTSLAAVRAGTERHVPDDQPGELQPLVAELNALIDQNAAGLAHARQHVANLAHGLKTPLAALSLKLAEANADADVRDMVDQIDRRVRHHLGRARADVTGGARTRTPIAPAVADLVGVLRRIHADRPMTVDITIPDNLAVAIDPQDLDEMVGNLLDNAWRHARAAVSITANPIDGTVTLEIADDGQGLDDTAMAQAVLPGRRLDERGDGHGFGLSITRELAELNGGTVTLDRSPVLGGLLVRLTLPQRG